MPTMKSPYKSRKYLTSVAALVGIYVIEFIHPGSGKNLEFVVPAIIASYHGANSFVAWAAARKG